MNKRAPHLRQGFTLIEVMVTIGLLAGIFAITGTVLVRTGKAWRSQEAYVGISAGLRDAALAISQELEAAALEDDSTISPPVKGISISPDSHSISYQTPAGVDGDSWNLLSSIRLRSEDLNKNLRLDGKEDVNGNGFLDRVIERVQDLNGDGDFDGNGESRIVARNIDDVQFVRDPGSRKIAVTVVSTYRDAGSQRTLSQRNTFTVVVRN